MRTANLIVAAFLGNKPVKLGAISGAELKLAMRILKERRSKQALKW